MDLIMSTDDDLKCTICQPPRRFGAAKTLSRHYRTLHQPSNFNCSFCPERFRRKDIKVRHEAEQHEGLAKKVHCTVCDKSIQQRVLFDHFKSKAHCRMEDTVDEEFMRGLKRDRRTTMSILPSNEALIDPLLLTTHLFSEAEPFSSGPGIWMWIDGPFLPPLDLLHLKCLAMRIINRRLREAETHNLCQLMWSIGILAAVSTFIEGWSASVLLRDMLLYMMKKHSSINVLDWLSEEKWRSLLQRSGHSGVPQDSHQQLVIHGFDSEDTSDSGKQHRPCLWRNVGLLVATAPATSQVSHILRDPQCCMQHYMFPQSKIPRMERPDELLDIEMVRFP